jgi:hypothetical protein
MPPGAFGRPVRFRVSVFSTCYASGPPDPAPSFVRGRLPVQCAPCPHDLRASIPHTRGDATKHPFTFIYSTLSQRGIPLKYANKRDPTGLSGMDHEANVTACMRLGRFGSCRNSFCAATSAAGLELASGAAGHASGVAAGGSTQSGIHAAHAPRRPARRYRQQCARASRRAARGTRSAAHPLRRRAVPPERAGGARTNMHNVGNHPAYRQSHLCH